MRKIINNKVYDTATAKLRGYWSNEMTRRDLAWCEESLYQKKTGEFFLHGEGGTMSKYAEIRRDNCWGAGSRICPLTVEMARLWAEERMDADEYDALFGPVVEDESRVMQTFSLAADALELLRRKSRDSGLPMGVILDVLIKSM